MLHVRLMRLRALPQNGIVLDSPCLKKMCCHMTILVPAKLIVTRESEEMVLDDATLVIDRKSAYPEACMQAVVGD